MVKRKAAVALSIFSSLFAGAWWLHVDTKKDYTNQMYQSYDPSVVLVGNNQDMYNQIQPFKPREYIRVVAKNKKEEQEEVEPT